MAEDNHFQAVADTLLHGVERLVTTKTVVGEPITVGEITILPLIDLSVGLGAGANQGEKKDKGMGGMGAKISTSAVLVVKDGQVRLVNIKNADTITKIVDMVPNVLDHFSAGKGESFDEEDVADIVNQATEA